MEKLLSHNTGFKFVKIIYISALGFIATLAIGSHIIIDTISAHEADTARMINLVGRMRILSQRVAMEAVELARPEIGRNVQLESDFLENLNRMETTFRILRDKSKKEGVFPDKNATKMAPHTQAHGYPSVRTRTFIDQGRSYLALPPAKRAGSPLLADLTASAQRPLLESFENAIDQHLADSEAADLRLRQILWGALAAMLATLLAEAILIFRPLFRKLEITQKTLLNAAITDPMTGCRNRRYFMEVGTHEVDRARRSGDPLMVALLDIDHFKSVNDTYGHAVGDDTIKMITKGIQEVIRTSDVVGRIGGEEFAILLPNTNPENAKIVFEKLRKHIEDKPVEIPSGAFRVTVSIGATSFQSTDENIDDVLNRADKALYDAKNSGRNRVKYIEADGDARQIPAERL